MFRGGVVTRAGSEPALARINALDRSAWEAELYACLAVTRWAREVAHRQPYESADGLVAAADAAATSLTPEEVDEALAGHPRIGEGAQGAGSAAAASRKEQSGVDRDDQQLATALREGNEAYEQRFGRIFLVCAYGLGGQEILGRLRARLDNDPETEAIVVADELRKITLLRIERLLWTGGET